MLVKIQLILEHIEYKVTLQALLTLPRGSHQHIFCVAVKTFLCIRVFV